MLLIIRLDEIERSLITPYVRWFISNSFSKRYHYEKRFYYTWIFNKNLRFTSINRSYVIIIYYYYYYYIIRSLLFTGGIYRCYLQDRSLFTGSVIYRRYLQDWLFTGVIYRLPVNNESLVIYRLPVNKQFLTNFWLFTGYL